MKKTYKILLLFVLMATTLLLVSCRKQNKTPVLSFANFDPEELVVDELDNSKKLDTAKFYQLLYTSALEEVSVLEAIEINYRFNIDNEKVVVNIDDLANEELSISDAYAKEYIFNIEIDNKIESVTIVQFKKDAVASNFDYTVFVNYLTFNDKGKITTNGSVLTNTYIFEGKNIKFYKINSEGVNEIDNESITFTGFPVGDELIVNRKYINNETFDVIGSLESGESFTFKVRLAATNKPLSTKTATFWNWIFLQMPIAYFMALVSGALGKSLAIGILITTIAVRTLAWPIYAKTNDMSLKMSLAQPDLQRLERKYALRKDPESQQKKQMEMMQIYKKYKINIFGCLLPILQMPIFFAMYQVVLRITIPGGQFSDSVTNTKFFGTELANGGVVAKLVFTALVGITMFALQKITQVKPSYAKQLPKQQNTQAQQTEQSMKMISYMMIFMMVFAAYATPGNGLSFYWIVGNIYSIGQTVINRKMSEVKYKKLEEEKLYGRSRENIDAKFTEKKGENNNA